MKIKPFKIFIMLLLIVLFAAIWQSIYKEGILKAAYPQRYNEFVNKYSQQSKIEPALVFAVIKSESGFNPAANSGKRAKGLMQLLPETFEWAQMLVPPPKKYTSSDLNTPEINIRYGTIVLSSLLSEFFGSADTALAAYYDGRGNVNKWLADKRYSKNGQSLDYIPDGNTRAYVKKVLETEKMYIKLYY
jgi:soluble lytic murein transglycosylase